MKKYLKKSLSVFLAFMMVFSCFVFAPEMFTMKADAATAGNYFVKIVWKNTNNRENGWGTAEEMSNSYTGSSCSSTLCAGISLWLKENNGTSTTEREIWWDIGKSSNDGDKGNGYTTSIGHTGSMKSEGTYEATATIKGFPTKIQGYIRNNASQYAVEFQITEVWLGKSASDPDMRQIWTGTAKAYNKGSAVSTPSATKFSFGMSVSNSTSGDASISGASKTNWKTPVTTTVEWTPNNANLTVPYKDSVDEQYGNSVTLNNAAKGYDQYGVSWYKAPNYYINASSGGAGTSSTFQTNLKSTTNSEDKCELSISEENNEPSSIRTWVANGGSYSRVVYVRAGYSSTVLSEKEAAITIYNPKFPVTFDANDGTFPDGSTKKEHIDYYNEKLGEELPTDGMRKGYEFDYMWTAKDGGTEVTAETPISGKTTYYAHWKPHATIIQYYDYNGQPLDQITGYYDQPMSKYVSKTLTAGKSPYEAADGTTYIFKRWINWETGEELDTSYVIDLPDNSVLKFIAEYTIDKNSIPKYTYEFYNNYNGTDIVSPIASGSKYYRNEVDFPADPTKADDTGKNGLQYTFAGWVAKSKNGADLSDIIVLPNQSLADAVAGKTFLPKTEDEFFYYLKENVVFVPVYTTQYRQTTVKLNFKDTDGEWATVSYKSDATRCQKYFDLGIPNPRAYNAYVDENGFPTPKTFEFIGWTTVREGTIPDSNMTLGVGTAINVFLEDDLEVWATYDEKAIEYTAYYYSDGSIFHQDSIKYGTPYQVGVAVNDNESGTIKAGDTLSPTKAREDMTGYKFVGWYLDPEFTQPAGDTYKVTDLNNPTFYAKYESFEYYAITFRDDDGSIFEAGTGKDYVENDKLTPPVVEDRVSSAKYAYVFVGWYDSSNGKFHPKDEELVVTRNETYTAYYEESIRKYTVSFYGVNGKGTDENGEETGVLWTGELEYGTKISDFIASLKEEGIDIVEEARKGVPENTKQYTYELSGWTPVVNDYTTVSGNAEYRATYKASSVIYKVHWFVPKSADNYDDCTETVTNYLYERIISVPSQLPTCDEPDVYTGPEPRDAYNWGFLGWYEWDVVNKTFVKDADGNDVPFVRGTQATKDHTYYAAKFGYIAKAFTISIYSKSGTLLARIAGQKAGETVYLPLSFTQAYTNDNHYIISNFTDKTDASKVVATVTEITEDGNVNRYAPYVVGDAANNDLVVNFDPQPHDAYYGEWKNVTERNYETDGVQERFCSVCGYRDTQTSKKLDDDQGPKGVIVIGGHVWDNGDDKGTVAYVRNDAFVSIIVRDLGNAEVHGDTTAGTGIQSIVYSWVDADGNKKTSDPKEFKKFTIDANWNFQLPEDFEGKYIEAVITDYVGKTYTIRSEVLNIDMNKPEIYVDSNCEKIFFAVRDDFEVGSVKVEKSVDGVLTELVFGEDYVIAGAGDMEEGVLGYWINNVGGEYLITVTDKAGNIATATVSVSGKHKFDTEIIDLEPTCTQDGSKSIVCSVCGEKEKEIVLKAPGHELTDDFVEDTAATCEDPGSKSYHCKNCDHKEREEEIAPLGHDEKVERKEPTCTTDGYILTTCSRCDLWKLVTAEDDETLKGKHVADPEKHVKKAPSCTEYGEEYDICAVCGEKIEPVILTAKTQHSYIEITPSNVCKGSRNDLNNAYSLWECTLCGNKLANFPEYKDHELVKSEKPVKDATCTEDAVYRYQCKYCDAYEDRTERLTSLNHDWQPDTKAATCTEAGYTQEKCSRCNQTQNRKDIAPLDHELVLDEESSVLATCLTGGTEVYKCVRFDACGKTETKDVPATGEHKYSVELTNKRVEATCFAEGSSTYQCEYCHEAEEVRTIAKLDHAHADGDEGKVLVKANCITEGIVEYTCIHTDEEGNTHTYEVNTGKNSSIHNENSPLTATHIDPTCEDAGEGTYTCPDCGSGFVGKIEPLGHELVLDKNESVPATCLTDGTEVYKCVRYDVCHEKTTKEIKATGSHTLTYREKVEATCVKDGLDAHYECTVCGELFKDNKALEATTKDELKLEATGEHKYEEKKVEPTCSKEGYTYSVCSVCGAETEHTNIADALGHVKGALVKVNKPATCLDKGEGVYKCTRCGETFANEIPADADAHSAVWTTEKKATCTEAGSRVKVCDICGKALEDTRTEIPELGHNFVVTRENVLKDNGMIVTVVTTTCKRCDYNKVEEEGAVNVFVVTFVIPGREDGTSTKTFENGGYLRDRDFPTVSAEDVPGKKLVVKWYIGEAEVVLPMKVTQDLEITAKVEYVDVEYTVKFVDNLSGREISKATYAYNQAVNAPAENEVPVHNGFIFIGWSNDPGAEEPLANEALPLVTEDVTYYTVYRMTGTSDKTYYVNFKNDTGTKTLVSVTVTEGSKVEKPENPTKNRNSTFHYNFAQWVDENGNAFDFETAITSNLVLYAQFNAVKHSERAIGIDAKAATCTSWAEVTYECKDCGYVWSQYIIDENNPPQHDVYILKETEEGNTKTITYSCHVCGETWTKTISTGTTTAGIVVTVKDSSGNAVAGARVQIYLGSLEAMTAITNENGQAIFPKYDAETAPNGLKDGSYTVKVTKSGYENASGTLLIKNGVGTVNLKFAKVDCHCVCHSSSFFGTIRRFFNKFFRLFNKNYVCCKCGQSEVIYK